MNALLLNYYAIVNGIHCLQSIEVDYGRLDETNASFVAAYDRAKRDGGVEICVREIDRATGLSVKPPVRFMS